MTKLKKIKLAIFITLLAVITIPVFGWAEFVTTGPLQSSPDPTDPKAQVVYITQPQDNLKINLKVPGNFSDTPKCTVSCDKPKSGPNDANRIACTSGDSFGYKDDGAISAGDNQNTSPLSYAEKDLVIKEAKPNNTYYFGCTGKDSNGNTLITDPVKLKVKEGGPCEVDFNTIKQGLKDFNIPVPITEVNFASWSEINLVDDLINKKSLGSGDQADLINYIIGNQSDCPVCVPSILNTETMNSHLSKTLRVGKPVGLNLYAAGLNSAEIRPDVFAHNIIGLKIISEKNRPASSSGGVAVPSGKDYIFEILDPNGPTLVTNFECKTADSASAELQGFVCSYHGEVVKMTTNPALLRETDDLFNARQAYCPGKSSAFCTRNIVNYLENKNNYPKIDNSRMEFGDGCCVGWSNFVLRVAYLGDFVGIDYHPNDGNVVGINCDANHHSAQSSETSLVPKTDKSQLANSFTAANNLLDNLANYLTNLKFLP